jgi:hypothetical protein
VEAAEVIAPGGLDPDGFSQEQLLTCFVEQKADRAPKKVEFAFISQEAQKNAATVVQTAWRSYLARDVLQEMKRDSSSRVVVQKWFAAVAVGRKMELKCREMGQRCEENFERI